jgi:hypothetical protein
MQSGFDIRKEINNKFNVAVRFQNSNQHDKAIKAYADLEKKQ